MTTAPEDYKKNSLSQVGPLGGLQAGVIAGVTGSTTSVDPIQAEIDRIKAAREPGMGKLADNQYPTKEITTADGRKVKVYTAGPLQGRELNKDGTTGDYVTGTEVIDNITTDLPVDEPVVPPLTTPVGLTEEQMKRKSAYDTLYTEFKKYGLEGLVEDVKGLIMTATSDAEITLGLRNSKNYLKRFGANAQRIKNGFSAIDEATYIGLEDKYQALLQNYGLPAKYYKKGTDGFNQYLETAISNNIDPETFEERITEGQKILNGSKFILEAAKQFYPTLGYGDFLDYVLNPKNALPDIQRKVTAAEIGGAQLGAGLNATASGAEELAAAGVTGKQYQKLATEIAQASLRGGQLASIYGQGPYTQQMAEQVQLDTPGSVESLKKTQKIAGLENAAFGARSGATGGALARDRAGAN